MHRNEDVDVARAEARHPLSVAPDEGGDSIGALLRTTGRRVDVPPERAARVEAAVRASWQAGLRRRTQRRWRWAALGASAAVVVLALSLRRPATGPAVETRAGGRVAMVSDTAWWQPAPDAAPVALHAGDILRIGAAVATEDRGRVALVLHSGHSLRLDAGTRVRVLSEREVALDRGAVYIDSSGGTRAAPGAVSIRTPLGDLEDVGTQFEVRLVRASVRVRVREGRVAFRGQAAALDVAAGHEIEVAADGRFVHRDLPAPDGGLDWVGSITPMIAIEGRTLQQFLEWMARERGLRLEFATRVLAASAPGIRLSGSIQGMTLDQALDSVLATCQMTGRVDVGVLHVEATPSRGSP